MTLRKEAFEKSRKWWFPKFHPMSETKSIVFAMFYLSSANAFCFDQSQILMLGNEITGGSFLLNETTVFSFSHILFQKCFLLRVIRTQETGLVFSSTGQRPASYCHGVVSVMRPSIRSSVRASVNFFFKKLLLRNYWLDFYQISQECSFGGPLLNSFK